METTICPNCQSTTPSLTGWTDIDSNTRLEGYQCNGDCLESFEVTRQSQPNSYDQPPLFSSEDLTLLQLGRLQKCLNRVYRFSEGTMSLQEWLESQPLTHKTSYTRLYARRKQRGCYKKLESPVTEYSVWVGQSGIDVPKMVWDALNLPEEENHV